MNGATVSIALEAKDVQPIIDANIHAAILEVLGRNPEGMIAAIVKATLDAPSANSGYGKKETVLQAAVNRLIREEAERAFGEFLAEHRELIHKEISRRLNGSGGKFAASLADQVMDGLAQNVYITAHVVVGKSESDA